MRELRSKNKCYTSSQRKSPQIWNRLGVILEMRLRKVVNLEQRPNLIKGIVYSEELTDEIQCCLSVTKCHLEWDTSDYIAIIMNES